MFNALKRLFCKKECGQLESEGNEGIKTLGHRKYVGGMWDEIGKLQFDFMVKQGLKPSNCLLDIACGSLRGGIHYINYLESGNYLGIDKEKNLIEIGIDKELGKSVYEEKKPEFVVSDRFEFEKLSKKPQYSVAQSLFTHLNAEDITFCLRALRGFVDKGHFFFVTIFEGQSIENPDDSHSHAGFAFSQADMKKMGEETGWSMQYIGDWNHPKNQKMIKYEAL